MTEYNDIDKCKSDLLLARKKFGLTTTTREQYDAMEQALGLMCLYCPKSIENSVLATLTEAGYRRIYYELNIWKD